VKKDRERHGPTQRGKQNGKIDGFSTLDGIRVLMTTLMIVLKAAVV
jgi:hypothetical protein